MISGPPEGLGALVLDKCFCSLHAAAGDDRLRPKLVLDLALLAARCRPAAVLASLAGLSAAGALTQPRR